jgi:hypothetical protein
VIHLPTNDEICEMAAMPPDQLAEVCANAFSPIGDLPPDASAEDRAAVVQRCCFVLQFADALLRGDPLEAVLVDLEFLRMAAARNDPDNRAAAVHNVSDDLARAIAQYQEALAMITAIEGPEAADPSVIAARDAIEHRLAWTKFLATTAVASIEDLPNTERDIP